MAEQFSVVLRGYDKEQVDAAFAESRENLARLREQIRSYDDRVLQLEAELQEERQRKAPQSKDSFASLGANAQQLLASAEQTSTELLNRAKQDAATTLESASKQAETTKNNAGIEADRIVAQAEAKAKSIIDTANTTARTITTNAKEQSDQLKSQTAKAVADQRQAIDLELQNSREEHAKRLAAEKASQERAIAELKAQATKQISDQRNAADQELTKRRSDANDQIQIGRAHV